MASTSPLGLLLLTAYPTKALTNPDFYVKLSFIGLAVYTMAKMSKRVFGDSSLNEAAMVAKGKLMARLSLIFWIGAVGAGRVLSETARYFFYGHPAGDEIRDGARLERVSSMPLQLTGIGRPAMPRSRFHRGSFPCELRALCIFC